MFWEHPALVAIAGALAGGVVTFLLQSHQHGKTAKRQDEHDFKEKVHDLESRITRLEVEMELFDKTGQRGTRKRGGRNV